MKLTRLPVCTVFLFLIHALVAQTNLNIASDAERAFPKANIVLASSEINVTFKTVKKDKLVAIVEQTDKYVSLDNNTSASFAIFYDEYSEIVLIRVHLSGMNTLRATIFFILILVLLIVN
jgi:hypothetical protein